MTKKSSLWTSLLTAAVLALPTGAYAITITGTVTVDSKPVRGALVTVFSENKQVAETVLTDDAGRYRLETDLHGWLWDGYLSLRARAPRLADGWTKIRVPPGNGELTYRFVLKRMTTPQEISDSLPASAFFAQIKFPTQRLREEFQTDCTPCHQTGGPMTRRPHSLADWKAITGDMLQHADYSKLVHIEDYAAALYKAFNGKPIPDHEDTRVNAAAFSARIVEWKMPQAVFPHDVAFYRPNGMFYSVDLFADQILITNPKTNQTTVVPLPARGGIPVGGEFAGQDSVPNWVPMGVRYGYHSLTLSPFDGKFYLAGSVGDDVGVFDPVSHSYNVYKLPNQVKWLHTDQFDSKGNLWLNAYLSNQIVRFDPKTGKSAIVDLPGGTARKDYSADARIPAPYGLDVNPVDDSVWYTQIWANKIGRVDPITLKVSDWVPPMTGPHRAYFDKHGGFWITGMGDDTITRLDTKTMKYDTYKMPHLAPGEANAPYSLAIDPKTDDVWVTANMSDQMFRFSPATKTWTVYPLPTRGLYMRDIVVTPGGWVCGPSSPASPAMDEYKTDGRPVELLCLEPEGNKPGGQAIE